MIAISYNDSFKDFSLFIKSLLENNLDIVISGTETRDSINRGGEYFWIKNDVVDVYLMYYNEETMEIDNDEYLISPSQRRMISKRSLRLRFFILFNL